MRKKVRPQSNRTIIHADFGPCSVVDDRKANPTTKKDLLNLMLNARDPVTGQGLPEENIRNNVRLAVFVANGPLTLWFRC